MARRKRAKSTPLPQLDRQGPQSNWGPKSDCGSIRNSTRGKWRALSLFLVHVAVALHIAHWWSTGKTITPLEPSEAMQTLGSEALVNAGFVLFLLTIFSTLIFGRFFCGWGCHLIAYQDLCTWILKKIGLKPRPFRSRLLVFVPLAAAIFMFVMPTLVRVIAGLQRAPYTSHFQTYDFWDRFPGWFVGALTIFVCGFVIVYFLGNKGFCTYACPYGGLFGLADTFAPGKIRVTDDCEQCGHCTAACSSNVRVHEEVNSFGMVVDPGCMKCLDCITVCPKDALYFGFGQPSVAKQRRSPEKSKRFDFSWPEEIAMAVFFLFSVTVLRKLYDGVPFLLALACASISAYALLSIARFAYSPNVRFARLQLRTDGRTRRAGYVFATTVTVWAMFLGHSAVVQIYTIRGRSALSAARSVPVSADDWSRRIARGQLDQGIAYLEKADAIGLVPVANVLFDLSMAYASRGGTKQAQQFLERAIEFSPRFAAGRYELASLLRRNGALDEAIEHLSEVVRVSPEFPHAHSDLASVLIETGRAGEAVILLEELTEQRPDVVEFQLACGLALAHDGAYDRALDVMRETAKSWPENPDAHFNLGSTLASGGAFELALGSLQEAARLNPESGLIHAALAQSAAQLGKTPLADEHLQVACDIDPFNTDFLRAWVVSVHRRGALDAEISRAERSASSDRAARYRLIFLYGAGGRNDDARRMAAEFMPTQEDR